MNRVEEQLTVLARAKEERLIRKCGAVVMIMRPQRYSRRTSAVKNRLMKLGELLDPVSFYKRAWTAAKYA